MQHGRYRHKSNRNWNVFGWNLFCLLGTSIFNQSAASNGDVSHWSEYRSSKRPNPNFTSSSIQGLVWVWHPWLISNSPAGFLGVFWVEGVFLWLVVFSQGNRRKQSAPHQINTILCDTYGWIQELRPTQHTCIWIIGIAFTGLPKIEMKPLVFQQLLGRWKKPPQEKS